MQAIKLSNEQLSNLLLLHQLIQAKQAELQALLFLKAEAEKSLGLDPNKVYIPLPDGRLVEMVNGESGAGR